MPLKIKYKFFFLLNLPQFGPQACTADFLMVVCLAMVKRKYENVSDLLFHI